MAIQTQTRWGGEEAEKMTVCDTCGREIESGDTICWEITCGYGLHGNIHLCCDICLYGYVFEKAKEDDAYKVRETIRKCIKSADWF